MSAPTEAGAGVAYPEHEKLAELDGATQIVGEFLEWLGEQKIVLARYEGNRDFPWPIHDGRDALIARHFGIDQNALEAEKRAMLESLRTGAQP